MKKLKLLFAICALMVGGVSVVQAQTDVTSTYLTNADFEETTALTSSYLYGYGKDGSPYGFQTVDGWTSVVTKGDNSNKNYPNSGTAAGVFSYGSSTQLKGNGKAAPATNPNGEASGKCFGFFGVWGLGGYYYQSVTLNPGNYTIIVPMYNQSGTQANTTYTGFFPTSGTSSTVAVNPTVGSWSNQTVSFTLEEATEGQIRIGYQSTGSGSGSNPHIFIDCVKIICTDFKAELRAVIVQAQAINARISTLNDDITTAQGVLNTASASKTAIDNAVRTLRSAISTKLAAYTGLNAAGDDITSFIANNGFETSPTFDGTLLGSGSDPKSNATPTAGSTLLFNAKNVYQINGWELLTTETSDFARTFTMPYNKTLYVWGNNNVAGQAVASPTNGSSVTTSNDDLLFVEANWCENAVLGVKQTVPLPAGSYRLTFDSYVSNAIGNADSRCGVSYGESTNYKWPAALNTWTNNEVDFTLDAQTDVTISMGYKKIGNVGGGSSAHLFIDNVKLTYFDPLKLAQIQWQAVHDALAALDATALPNAAEEDITNALNAAEPTTVDGYNSSKETLQDLIDRYDGIKAAFDAYKALKATIEDLKNTSKYTFTGAEALSTFNSTLSTIDGNAEAATDAATLNDLLPSLKTAGNTFVGAIASNDGFDLTYNIENNSFETGALSPWTTNGSNDTGVKPNSNGTYTTTGVDGAYLFNTWNNGAGSKVSQTLSSLPEGYYTVTALVASDAGNTINILAGASTKGIASDATNGKSNFVEGTTDKVLVSDGSLEIGTNSSTWYKSDYFRLTFYTVTSGARDAWLAAKAAAEAARDDAAYANVSGSEKTELLAEIAKAEPTTAEAYGTATTALQEKTSAFIAAKDSYDALVAMRTTGGTYTTVAWPRASAAKATALADAIAAAPTDAADAVTKTNAIVTAYRQFVESNGLAEGVDGAVDYTNTYLAGADPDTNTGWTGGIGTDWRSQEIYTKGDGEQGGRYYDGGWSGSAAVNINMTRELTLPAGQYQLQITARGSASLTSYTMSIGGETVNLPIEGSEATVGTFGHGWSDKWVVFDSDGSTPLTLAIAATSTEYQQWISFNRLRLVLLEANNDIALHRQAWEDTKNALATLDATALPDAAEEAITNALNAAEPTTVEGYDNAKDAMQALINSYDGIKAAYDKALALITLATNEKTNSTGTKTDIEEAISTATTNIETRTSADDLTNDYNTLESARQIYVTGGAQPTANNVFDLTFKISDATVTGSGNWSNKGTANGQQYTNAPDNKYMDCGWNTTYQSYQTVSDLPAGYYTLKAATRARETDITAANVYVNQYRSELNRSTDNHKDGNTGGELGNGWSWTEVNFELRATGSVSVGFYAQTTGQGWAGADDFHLYYKGNAVDDETAEALKGTVVSGKMNSTVSANQSSALSAFETEQTIENYEALEVAIVAASASKNAYIAANEKLTAMKAVVDATNVYTADALNTYYTTPKGKYDDNSLTDEEAVALQNPSTQTGWHAAITVDNFLLSAWNTAPDFDGENSPYYINTWSTEGTTDGTGMTTPFFEYYVDYTADGKLAERTLTATMNGIAPGNYYVDVLVRVSKNAGDETTTHGITLDINGGDATDICNGEKDANARFYGTFRAIGTVGNDGILKININVADDNNVHWLAFKNVMYIAYDGPTAEQKTALANAISTADDKTIGFEDGQYAPYNNVAGLEALAAAKAIDAESATSSEVVAATTALTSATWTANNEDVDAIYNGMFTTVAEGQNYPDGWKRTNGWGQMRSGIDGVYNTAYYNQPGSLQYGNQGVYTMPLNANTYYKLTFAYRSHETNSNQGVTASVLKGEEGMAATTFDANGSTSNWKVATKYFRTGEAGNYVLTLANSGNTWMTAVSLTKAITTQATLTITSAKYGTFIAPFDVPLPEGVTAYTVTDGDQLTMTEVQNNTIPANTPVVVNSEEVVSESVSGYSLAIKDSYTVEALTGTYVDIDAPDGSYVLQNHDGKVGFYKVDYTSAKPKVRANRAYLSSGSNARSSFLFEDSETVTAVNAVKALTEGEALIYDMNGVQQPRLKKGMNIIRTKDGRTQKVMVR